MPYLVILGALIMANPVHADVKGPAPFGTTADGTAVESCTSLTN